jgi:hypothetical protein
MHAVLLTVGREDEEGAVHGLAPPKAVDLLLDLHLQVDIYMNKNFRDSRNISSM